MKHLSKKSISLILLVTVLAGAVSCGGDSTDSGDTTTQAGDTTTAAEVKQTRLDELGERDFDQATFTVFDANNKPHLRSNVPTEENMGETINDALYNRDIALEERYNVNIEYVSNAEWAGYTYFKNSILSGEDAYQMLYARIMQGFAYIYSDGVLANLADSEYLSLDREWWSPLMYESVKLKGKMYFTTGDIVPSYYQLPSCLFYNKTVAENYNIDTDLVGMVNDGKWTLDELLTMTKDITQDVDNDGKMTNETDIFGVSVGSTNSTTTVRGWFAGAGVKFSEITDNGTNISVNFADEHTLSVFEKIMNFMDPEFTQKESEDYLTIAFADDRVLFAGHFVESASSFLRDSEMESDYLIVPMPKYDENQETYVSCVNPWIEAFVGLSSLSDLDFTGFMAEAMAAYSHEKIRPLAWDMTYGTKLARDEATAEMLDIIFETSYIDFNMLFEFGNSVTDVLLGACNGKSLTTEFARLDGAIKGDIAKFVENWG